MTGLTGSNVRLHLAKLVPAANGDTSYWQSYINRVKTPAVNPDNPDGLQATSESGGDLVDHGDGTYTYTFQLDINNVTSPLEVPYEPQLTHRVAMQFSGGYPINPYYDWVPASGSTSGILQKDVAATETCNTCHNPLAMHGGGRQAVELCVTCHNPGTIEPNSGENMDLAVLVHRIHSGSQLPSVQAGDPFVIWGYRDSEHDYSDIVFPQDTNNCAKCHTGSATALDPIVAPVITGNGDNWHEVPTMAACGSCHDDLDFALHEGGQTDNSGCLSCHSASDIAGSVRDAHTNKALVESARVEVKVLAVTATAPGSSPTVRFSVTNPDDSDAPYDILNDPKWTSGRLRLGIAWDTTDFTNTGISSTDKPFYQTTDALTAATSNGDGTYTLVSETVIPDGSQHPFRAATGSGMAIFEGRLSVDGERVPFTMDPFFFPITDSSAKPRRQVVSMDNCNACHGALTFHGDLRTNTEAGCQGCHNPRVATDAGESIDMKRMIHGIHAAAVRENALVIRGGPFDTEVVQFPGELSDCRTCHVGNTFQLPIPAGVLAVTTDMGADLADPADDLMITPQAAACTACHDDSLAKSHMEQNGADFTATEATIEAGVSTETCEVCHGAGRTADVLSVHGLN